MASNFLAKLLGKRTSSQRPQIDTHALYTSSQMSRIMVQGQLSVHEPWRKNKKKPKIVFACLYTNDSSPFIAWYTDKARKKPRGFFNLRGGKIAPVGEYSFQIAFSGSNNNSIYKFNTECWEQREHWLYSLREESRKEVQMPTLNTVNDSIRQSKDDLAVMNNKQQSNRPAWKSHRRTLSAGSPSSPNLSNPSRCQVQLQRSRSQPHIQKGKLVKKRPTLLEKQRTVGQTFQRDDWFVRSPEVCRS